jgi:hypothetical protein
VNEDRDRGSLGVEPPVPVVTRVTAADALAQMKGMFDPARSTAGNAVPPKTGVGHGS